MAQPIVSIVVPSYNHAHFLPIALDSALAQSYSQLEILILDDASTDETSTIIQPYLADPRIRYIRNEQNLGLGRNLNKAISLATGEYITTLGSDDRLMPDYIATSIEFLQQHPEVDLVYGDLAYINEEDTVRSDRAGVIPAQYIGGISEFARSLYFCCFASLMTITVSRRIYERYGLLKEDITGSDLGMLMRWTAAGLTMAHIPQTFGAFRVRQGQASDVKNYTGSGKDAREFYDLVRGHLTPENAHKIAGFEQRIKNTIQWKYDVALQFGYQDDGTLEQKRHDLSTLVDRYRTQNSALRQASSFSVIVYGVTSEQDLSRSLQSLTAQTYQDWEAIVVLKPQDLLATYCATFDPKRRVKPLVLEVPCQLGTQLNYGILAAQGNCYAFLQSGNLFRKNYLATLAPCFREQAAQVTVSSFMLHNPIGWLLSQNAEFYASIQPVHDLLISPLFPLDALAMRREHFDLISYLNPNLQTFIGWDFMLRTLHNKEHPFGLLDEIHLDVPLATQFRLSVSYAQELYTTFEAFYNNFTSENPEILRRRAAQLSELSALIKQIEATPQDQNLALQVACWLYTSAKEVHRDLNPLSV